MLAAVAASESNLAPPLVRLVPTVARPAAQQAPAAQLSPPKTLRSASFPLSA